MRTDLPNHPPLEPVQAGQNHVNQADLKQAAESLATHGWFDRLISTAIDQRGWVMLAVVLLIAIGVMSYQRLPIDAVPDITNVQVQINTAAAGYTALESEQRITYPIETAMAGLPDLVQTRSLSRYGLSQVTVIFADGTDIYFARQLISQRLQEAREQLPDGVEPIMAPVSTGLGEIYHWSLVAQPDAKKADGTAYSADDLREIQDWVIRPQLRQVAGVAEINTIGGHVREYQVQPDYAAMSARGISLAQLQQALAGSSLNRGAGYINQQGQQLTVRIPAQLQNLADIEQVVVSGAGGLPIRVGDIAKVSLGQALRSGAATLDGEETVLGTAMMMMGANSRVVSRAVDAKMQQIQRSLPAGVEVLPVYDRTKLVDKAIATVQKNLTEGALLVIAVLFLFLGNLRAALITALVIPLSMLWTITGMVQNNISANLMSLGALDFGIIVDGAVVIVENCMRRLSHRQALEGRLLTRSERFAEVFLAAREARRPLIFGQLIIIVVYLPVFALTGIEAKLFHPMAATVILALLGAMILSVTFVPAAVAMFVTGRVTEKQGRVMGWIQRGYQPTLRAALASPSVVLTAVVCVLLLSGLLVPKLGSEFTPTLGEGDLAVQSLRAPSTSVDASVQMQQQLERELIRDVPEISHVFARTGTSEIASDPMPPNISDAYLMLKPRSEWSDPNLSKDQLQQKIQIVTERQLGSAAEFSQPIEMRFNELISGVRSDLAIKVYGDDLAVLAQTAEQIAARLRQVTGASSVNVEQVDGLPMLSVQIDRVAAARYGLSVADIQDMVATAVAGLPAGQIILGDRRFSLTIRAEQLGRSAHMLQQLPLALPNGGTLLLSSVAQVQTLDAPNQISRENGKRRVVVTANVDGRDLGSFVGEVQTAMAQDIQLPEGYWLDYGGQFENLQSAQQRLSWVIPLALLMVLTLLYAMFGNLKDTALVFTGIPFALTGGIVALWLRDIPLSVSAAVGFIALSGVAVLNGLVMLSFIRELRQRGLTVEAAVWQGALIRLRPVLMTALVASLGFVPMALATGTGAEVQRPLATVVIGGILSSTLLTLIVLPLLYRWAYRHVDQTLPPQDPLVTGVPHHGT